MWVNNLPRSGLSVGHDCLQPLRISVSVGEGGQVSETSPLERPVMMEWRVQELERRGVLVGPRRPRTPFEGGVYVDGALDTFLKERG